MTATGPLRGVRVLELASLAPAPFACTMLSDLGAEVLRIERTDTPARDGAAQVPLARGRRSAAIDLTAVPGREERERGADGVVGRAGGGGLGATGRRGDRVADSWVGKTWRERQRRSG